MKATVKAVSVAGAAYDETEAQAQAGQRAAMCYTQQIIDEIKEAPEVSVERALTVIAKGHHSVAQHVFVTIGFAGITKMGAMILNSLQVYTTSEKSARYTKMVPQTEQESEMYQKWCETIGGLIVKKYPAECEAGTILPGKLAMENARYMLSVFTPTNMDYTTSVCQYRYIMHWCRKLEDRIYGKSKWSEYDKSLYDTLISINNALDDVGFKPLDDGKNRCLDFLAAETGQKHLTGLSPLEREFGLNYSATRSLVKS